MTQKIQSRTTPQFPLRMPDQLRDQIKEQARRNGHSINTEIIIRLQASLTADGIHHPDQKINELIGSNKALTHAVNALIDIGLKNI